MSRLNVAIVGAGLSGLTLGLALRKFAPDIDFVLYEGASKLSELGAGVSLWPRAWYVLQAIGLESALLSIVGGGGAQTIHLNYRKSDQSEGWGLDDIKLTETNYTCHRAEMQQVLLEQLQNTHIVHLGKRLQSYSQSGEGTGSIQLRFQDATTATCDILIGADGVRSAVRGAMYTRFADAAYAAGKTEEGDRLNNCIPAVFSGFIAYRSLIHKAALSDEDTKHPALNTKDLMLYCGKNTHMVVYPISQGRTLNVAAFVSDVGDPGAVYEGPWTSSVTKEEIVGRFKTWEPDAQEIVKQMQEPSQKWVVNVCNELPTYTDGRVVLVGDAAHAMVPAQGAGAGQCFEDIYLLAKLLSHGEVTRECASVALKVYDEIRRPFSQKVAALSHLSGRTMHFNTPQYAHLTVEESGTGTKFTRKQLREMVAALREQGSWRQGPSVAEDLDTAFKSLNTALSKE